MKNVLKTLLFFSIISTFFVSCSDNEITSDEQSVDLNEPLAYNNSMEDITVSFDLESLIVPPTNEAAVATIRSCPAANHAWTQLQNLSCQPGQLYCYYLEVFWRIDLDIAKINCYGCNSNICVTNVIEYSVAIDDLHRLGLHIAYVHSLISKLQSLDNTCDAAC